MARKERTRTITLTRKVKQEEKPCLMCGKRFWGAPISRYCSRACRNKANYERHAEAYRQERRERYRTEKA